MTYSHTVAITGASGYIGKHLIPRLRQLHGIRIKVLSRRKFTDKGISEFGPEVEVTTGDLHNPSTFTDFLEPGCTVVHLAYLQGGGESSNLAATENLLVACKAAQVGRLIHCSTAAVVGRVTTNLINEDTICNPISEYGITKLKIEQKVREMSSEAFDVVVLRPTSVFGTEGGSLRKLQKDLLAKKHVRNYLKACLFGRRRLNLVYVDNVVAAIIFMMFYQNRFGGDIFIISEDDVPGNNFADVEAFMMSELLGEGRALRPLSLPLGLLSFLLKILRRNNVNPACNYDPSKLMSLGFERPVTFDAGLKTYADWCRLAGYRN